MKPIIDQQERRRRKTLSAIASVTLDPQYAEMLAAAELNNGGPAVWRARKRAEARDLLALAQIAPPGRMGIAYLDLRQQLRAIIRLRVPVACRGEAEDEVVVADRAVLGLSYCEAAVVVPQPGFSFITILAPGAGIWHPSVSSEPPGMQLLCLGHLPAGISCRELVLLAYGALQMTTVQKDERDPAGVMNVDAARYWQLHAGRLPLSRTPFLSPD